jgi:hypothetical protein
MPRSSRASYDRNRELQRKRNVVSNAARKDYRRAYDRGDDRRPFVGWDGEGYSVWAVDSRGIIAREHHYMLFGCSAGYYETSRDLSTVTCLNLILYVESKYPDAFHVGFSFEYDVNMILRDLEWRYLGMLHDTGSIIWNGYRIKHIPHKLFSVSKNGVSATIYDVFGFFHVSYMKALQKFGIGTAQEQSVISTGKEHRSVFSYSQIKEVITYWSTEISLLPELMDHLRTACYDAGFFITRWHGPGALASYAIRQYKITACKPGRKTPKSVYGASRYAYAGGRFQSWKCGLTQQKVYTADINSAYAYACSLLPRLDNRSWHYENKPDIKSGQDIAHFGLYHIRFDAADLEEKARCCHIPFPLFHRDSKGVLTWPFRTEVWCWSPEAALVAGDSHAQFLESWIYDDDGSRPFGFVAGAYDRRLQLQESGNPAEKAYKWFLASIYGQLAQRVGWDRHDRTAPRSHCLEWAGYITSYCRAYVYRAALGVAARGGLISIDTDGVTSSVPFDSLPGTVSPALGDWKLDQFDGLLYWQNGIYWYYHNGNWSAAKARGVPKGRISVDTALAALNEHDGAGNPAIRITRNRFIGYRQALQHQFPEWRQWVTESAEIEFGGNGKGRHVRTMCDTCADRSSGLHAIIHFPPAHEDSRPHTLPWLSEPYRELNVEERGIWEDDSV